MNKSQYSFTKRKRELEKKKKKEEKLKRKATRQHSKNGSRETPGMDDEENPTGQVTS
ncbi:MAG: hypothetical protein ABIJ04_02460 [Bacteroidota bacterium]